MLSAQAAWVPHISEEVPLAGPLAYEISAAASRRSVFVAWADGPPGSYIQRGARLSHTGDWLDRRPMEFWPSPFSFQNTHTPLTVASDGSGFLMVRLVGSPYGWFHDGSKNGLRRHFDLPGPTNALYSVTGFGLAGGASGYVAAWTVARRNAYATHRTDFACLRMDRKGRPLMPNAIIVNPNNTFSYNAAAASCRDRFLVAWQTEHGLQAVIMHGEKISAPLLPMFGELRIVGFAEPSVTGDKDSFVIGGGGGGGLNLARFDLSGALVKTNFIPVGTVSAPHIVKLPDRLLAIYTADWQATNSSIRGLQIDGNLEADGEPFLIADQVGWWGKARAVPTRHGEVLTIIERIADFSYTNAHVFTRRIRFDASAKR